MRTLIIFILTVIVAVSYAQDTSVRGIIDGSINYIQTTADNFKDAPVVENAVETVEETTSEVVDTNN